MGGFEYPADQLPMDEYRTWRLCTILHCRPSELENESAVELDWLLAVDDTVKQAKAEAERRSMDNAR